MIQLPFSMGTAYFVIVSAGVVLISLAHLENRRRIRINNGAVKIIAGGFGLYLVWKYVFGSILAFM